MAASSPATSVTGGVKAVAPLAWASMILLQSSVKRGEVEVGRQPPGAGRRPRRTRAPAASSAPSVSRRRPRRCPRHRSQLHAAQARDGVHHQRRAGRPHASAIARTSCTTPVEVSDWVTNTALAPAAASAPGRRPAARPRPARRASPRPRRRAHIFSQRSPKLPAEATTTRSPGETRLATADSIADVPEPGITSTGFAVANTRPSPASRLVNSCLNSGLRWWITGRARAASTSGGTGVGPGVIR